MPELDVDREYRRHRRSAYAGIFVGYASYYLVRNTLALAIPDILKEYPQHSKADLGWALTGLSISYGVSKFLMGSVSDRSNPKYFLPLGLLLSCGIMAASGAFKAIYASLGLVIGLQILNGWAQGMGWPPSGKTMVHWFSTKERGLVVSFWNIGHNVGGALVATFAVLGVALFHDWGAKLYFNAAIAAAVAILAFFLLRDTPESLATIRPLCPVSAGVAAPGRILEDVSFINASGLARRGAIRRAGAPPLAFFEREEWMRAWFPAYAAEVTRLCRRLSALLSP